MELNITRFFRAAEPSDYSASIAEIGRDAGRVTWQAACDDADDYALLDTEEKREAFKAFIHGFGAWSDAEVALWSHTELNALCIQFIAGDIREAGLDSAEPDWAEYEAGAQAGRYAGRLFLGIDGEVYYYIGE